MGPGAARHPADGAAVFAVVPVLADGADGELSAGPLGHCGGAGATSGQNGALPAAACGHGHPLQADEVDVRSVYRQVGLHGASRAHTAAVWCLKGIWHNFSFRLEKSSQKSVFQDFETHVRLKIFYFTLLKILEICLSLFLMFSFI